MTQENRALIIPKLTSKALIPIEHINSVDLFFHHCEAGMLDKLLLLAHVFSISPTVDRLTAQFLPPHVEHFEFETEVWLPADVPDQCIEFSGTFGGKKVNYTVELFTVEEEREPPGNYVDASTQERFLPDSQTDR